MGACFNIQYNITAICRMIFFSSVINVEKRQSANLLLFILSLEVSEMFIKL